jgi:maltose O-acetyltransferase
MPTEKEKMLSGAAYDATDPELRAQFDKAKRILTQFNATDTADIDGRTKILQTLFGAMGKGVYIEPPFFCDYGENIFLGEMVYLNTNCIFLDCNKITVGNRVLFGPNVHIYAAFHPLVAKERIIPNEGPAGVGRVVDFGAPVTIGSDVWIGGNVSILPGITIGNNVVIGAGSVVTKNIPSNTIAFGNPCKVVRYC